MFYLGYRFLFSNRMNRCFVERSFLCLFLKTIFVVFSKFDDRRTYDVNIFVFRLL